MNERKNGTGDEGRGGDRGAAIAFPLSRLHSHLHSACSHSRIHSAHEYDSNCDGETTALTRPLLNGEEGGTDRYIDR